MGSNIDLFRTVLVPVDFSPCSNEAFRLACELARLTGANVMVLHVIDTSALAALHRLGLLAVPSDGAAQRKPVAPSRTFECAPPAGIRRGEGGACHAPIVEGAPFVEIAEVGADAPG